jgi:hypothetical protein
MTQCARFNLSDESVALTWRVMNKKIANILVLTVGLSFGAACSDDDDAPAIDSSTPTIDSSTPTIDSSTPAIDADTAPDAEGPDATP